MHERQGDHDPINGGVIPFTKWRNISIADSDVLVEVGSTRLTKIFQEPGLFNASLDITFRENVPKFGADFRTFHWVGSETASIRGASHDAFNPCFTSESRTLLPFKVAGVGHPIEMTRTIIDHMVACSWKLGDPANYDRYTQARLQFVKST